MAQSQRQPRANLNSSSRTMRGGVASFPLISVMVSIGRLEGNTIRLKEHNVARRHTRLSRSDDENIFCEDPDLYNGLWVDSERLGQTAPTEGDDDLLCIGDL